MNEPMNTVGSSSAQPIIKVLLINKNKLANIVGRQGECKEYIQSVSGAQVQVTKDADAAPNSTKREVILTGSAEQVEYADNLINDAISRTHMSMADPNWYFQSPRRIGDERFALRVPNEMVGKIIGKNHKKIKKIAKQSNTWIEFIPPYLPPGDTSKERVVYVEGNPTQIKFAQTLIRNVINKPERAQGDAAGMGRGSGGGVFRGRGRGSGGGGFRGR